MYRKRKRGLTLIDLLGLFFIIFLLNCIGLCRHSKPPEVFTNSMGMRLVPIEPGTFIMGEESIRNWSQYEFSRWPTEWDERTYASLLGRARFRNWIGYNRLSQAKRAKWPRGEWDECPHQVKITRAFYIAATEVTNAQYEQFDPEHRKLRGKDGMSKTDNEAVVFVSWNDVVRFCEWLSKKEGRLYRLPTEAEWEYACRAGTSSSYNTGEELPKEFYKHQTSNESFQAVSVRVGQTPANAWGLYDMHGNVEEWCHDWYGPYPDGEQADPVGPAIGSMKISRGGSHNTHVRNLRSANRMGTVPEDRNYVIGFRVVVGDMPETRPAQAPVPKWACDVRQQPSDWGDSPDPGKPYFAGPIPYVRKPNNPAAVPFYYHNHCPALTWCPNGDLIAVWYSCVWELGRELLILGSRLRAGKDQWDMPAPFFHAPDRNTHGCAFFHDGDGRLRYFGGLDVGGGHSRLALAMMESTNNGVTWSAPQLIRKEHSAGNQVIAGVIRTQDHRLIVPCDQGKGTVLHTSSDNGRTWQTATRYGWQHSQFAKDGGVAGWIAGIHAGLVQFGDGTLMAIGRSRNIQGCSPKSLSRDGGHTWTYSASAFPAISGNQRLVLMRLREGPLLCVSFTGPWYKFHQTSLKVDDVSNESRAIRGLFAALSFDEGKTWPVRRLITDGGSQVRHGAWRTLPGINGIPFVLDKTHAEPRGYLAATQTPDRIIHIISSKNHYQFNLAWLKTTNP